MLKEKDMKISAIIGLLSLTLFIPQAAYSGLLGDAMNTAKGIGDKAKDTVSGHHGNHDGKGSGGSPFGDLGLGDMDLGLDGLGLDGVPGMDMLGGDKKHHNKKHHDNDGDGKKDHNKKHHGDDEDDKKHHHKKHDDNDGDGKKDHHDNNDSASGLFGSVKDLGGKTMGALGGLQDFSTKLNDTMLAMPEKLSSVTNSVIDKGTGLGDQLIDATGMGNNAFGQTLKGVGHGVADATKKVVSDLGTFVRIYDTYMMGSGVASVFVSSISKNIKANLHQQNVNPDELTHAQFLDAAHKAFQDEGKKNGWTQAQINGYMQGLESAMQQGMPQQGTQMPQSTQQNSGSGHHSGHHQHHNNQQVAAPAA